MVLHLNKLEHQSPKDALCYVLLKLAQWFWRKLFNFIYVFLLFCNYLPLKKGQGPSFEQNRIPFTQEYFVLSLVEIGPVVLEKKMKMWKVYDNGQILIRKANPQKKHT